LWTNRNIIFSYRVIKILLITSLKVSRKINFKYAVSIRNVTDI
jgi:hypothetical protein